MNAGEHTSQLLEFARRVVLLEQENDRLRSDLEQAQGSAMTWHKLADDLAETLRAIARGECPPIISDETYSNLPLMRWKRRREEEPGYSYRMVPVERFEEWP